MGNVDKSNRYSAEEMRRTLIIDAAQNIHFTIDQVPKLETIRSWISQYSKGFSRKGASKFK